MMIAGLILDTYVCNACKLMLQFCIFEYYNIMAVVDDAVLVLQRTWRRIYNRIEHIHRRRAMEALLITNRKDRRGMSFSRTYMVTNNNLHPKPKPKPKN